MAGKQDKKAPDIDRPALRRLREDLRWLQGFADPEKPDKFIPATSSDLPRNLLISTTAPPPDSKWNTDYDPSNPWPKRPEPHTPPAEGDVVDLLESLDRLRRIWTTAHQHLPHELLFDIREPVWKFLRPPLERALVWLDDAIGPSRATASEIGPRRFKAELIGDDRHVFVVGDGLLDDVSYGPWKIGDIGWGIAITLMQLPREKLSIGDLVAKIDRNRIEGLGLEREVKTKVDRHELASGDSLPAILDTVPNGLLSTKKHTDRERYDVIQNNWRKLDQSWRNRWFTFNKQELTLEIHEKPQIDS